MIDIMVKCPRCEICGSDDDVNMIKFGNYQPMPKGYCGQSKGLEWICKKHLDQVKQLQHCRSDSVIRFIKAQEHIK